MIPKHAIASPERNIHSNLRARSNESALHELLNRLCAGRKPRYSRGGQALVHAPVAQLDRAPAF